MTKLKELSLLVDGALVGNPDLEITGVSEVKNGIPGTITFVNYPKYKQYLNTTEASAVLTGKDENLDDMNGIISDNPTVAFSKILNHFAPKGADTAGIHKTAVIDDSAVIGKNVAIGPFTVIERNVQIGDDVRIGPQCTVGIGSSIAGGSELKSLVAIYEGCKIGADVLIHSGTVIGCDGYGFATELPGNETYAGMPARKISKKNKQDALFSKLPEMVKQLQALEERLAQLEKNG